MGDVEGGIAMGERFIGVIAYEVILLRVIQSEGGAGGETEVFSWLPAEIDVKSGEKGAFVKIPPTRRRQLQYAQFRA